MTEQEAIELVQKEVLSSKPDCALIQEAHEEYQSCFVLYYQSSKYISSGNTNDMYVGYGPVIVCKNTSRVLETGSQKTTQEYVDAFDACGDPNAVKTEFILVSGWVSGAKKVDATKTIKFYSGLGLADSKKITDSALNEVPSSFKVNDKLSIDAALKELKEAGFRSRQLWSNEC